MKKIIALLLVLVMCVGFASCGNNSSDSDADYITDKGELVIGITYFEPMNYLTDSGELTGFETEFAQAVCDELGLEAKFQEINWAAKETELAAKNIDCIWNGMTIDEERLAAMSISTPYLSNKQVLVVKSENAQTYTTAESLAGKSVVAEKESAGETVITEDAFFAQAEYTAVDTMAKAIMEVAAGTADACVVDYVTSIGMIGEGTDYADLVVVDSASFSEEEYGIAFRKGSDFTAEVNAAITKLVENGKLEEIATKYKLQDLLIAK